MRTMMIIFPEVAMLGINRVKILHCTKNSIEQNQQINPKVITLFWAANCWRKIIQNVIITEATCQHEMRVLFQVENRGRKIILKVLITEAENHIELIVLIHAVNWWKKILLESFKSKTTKLITMEIVINIIIISIHVATTQQVIITIK